MDNKITETHEGKKSGKMQLVVAFILGLIVGILVAPTFFGDKAALEVEMETPKMEEGTEMENADKKTSSQSSVTVSDQLAGDRVLLKEVSFETSGWAVVHEDIEGVPGNALGAQRFDEGTRTDGFVDLLRETESNKVYYVLLYADDGDGAFDLKKDAKIIDGENGPVMATFNTITIDRKNN